jgi:xylose isomerase
MNNDLKLATNLVPFSRVCDRFVPGGYNEGYDFRKKLEMAGAIAGIKAVALGWPSQFQDGAAIKKMLDDMGLKLGLVEPDIYGDPCFKNGSISNPDPKIRRLAIERIKGTIDAALQAGSPDMNLWLGQDGFDYYFQGHYPDVWNWIVESLQEVADYNDKITICLEYKCKEPRAHQYVANAGTALLLVQKINKPHVGITVDVGHALNALEDPACSAALAAREGRLRMIHLNDNHRDWDHDLVPGAVNVWDHVELFYWVRKLGFSGWYSIDVFPYREDGSEALKRTVEVCRKCCMMADRLMEMNMEDLLRNGRHLEALRLLWDMVGN